MEEKFDQLLANPGSEAVDAFTCDWSVDNNWLFPPIYLIPRVIRHAQATGAKGTLIVPQWRSAPFWPLLFPNGSDSASFILEWLVLPCWDGLILPGSSGQRLFCGFPNTPLLAIRLQCCAF